MAPIAEKFDNMGIRKFYRLFPLGMFIRLLQAQIEFTGKSPLLASAHQIASAAFEALTAELEADLNYTVIPIQKLVRVQLGSALMAAQYATTPGRYPLPPALTENKPLGVHPKTAMNERTND
jgi:hypothetical protein